MQNSVGFTLKNLDRAFRNLVEKRTGLQAPQLFILGQLLYAGGRLSQKSIEERMEISRPAISLAVTRLENSGCLKRCMDESDKRGRILVLTEDGERLARQKGRIFEDISNEIDRTLTDQERAEFLRLSEKIKHRMEEMKG